jgi:nitrite reductase (NADH) large subunit
VAGYARLSPIRRDEADTLERLGLGAPNRMACVARAEGSCSVSLKPDRTSVAVHSAPTFAPAESLRRVVVIGNGIAGVTAADFIRRNHPSCEIALIGSEVHQLYNRMGVARLIHGRSAMQGLYLLPNDWYEKNGVSLWLNTKVLEIDRETMQVRLGTGERLGYDRLVIATGGRATVPPIDRLGIAGTFVLRDADDAMKIRAYSQDFDEHRAIVVGGGLLGLEAAHALHVRGMSVTILERSSRLLARTLDPVASEMLRSYFEALGIAVRTETQIAAIEGADRLVGIVTAAGDRVPAEVLLVATGLTPGVSLAQTAGLATSRGVLVDDHMRTSDPAIYAVGDVAEFDGHVWGLWPVAVAQAQVAAINIAGGDRSYQVDVPTRILKGVGLDVVSFGHIDGENGDRVIVERGEGGGSYRKVVIRGGRIVGGVFLGFGDDAQAAREARDAATVLTDDDVARMAARDWMPLRRAPLAAV